MTTNPCIQTLGDEELLTATRGLVRRSVAMTADLVLHLGEIDARKMYRGRAFSSMYGFCVGELGFSEDVAYNHIQVARVARKVPAVLEALRSGRVHLAGLRILAPHLTQENCASVLAEAAGKSKRDIEELAAKLAPKPPVADSIRKLPARRALRDKIRQAQELLRHGVPDGELATLVERAIDLLIADVKKKRFGLGRNPKPSAPAADTEGETPSTRHVPMAIRREVVERDAGRCTFTHVSGRRCTETGGLEFDHVDGFARTGTHSASGIRLRCRVHNLYAAEQMYGRAFMERARRRERIEPLEGTPAREPGTRPGATPAGDGATRPGATP